MLLVRHSMPPTLVPPFVCRATDVKRTSAAAVAAYSHVHVSADRRTNLVYGSTDVFIRQ